MSHHQRAVGVAVLLNTTITVGEALAGFHAKSLSLLMDSAHNLSDEMALVALWLAFIVPHGPSRALQRGANAFNSGGLIIISSALLWQAAERLLHPVVIAGVVPIIAGLAAALANYGVARLLRDAGKNNASIRLAYVHNLGDVWVSLAPVMAGLLSVITGYSAFDPLIAGAVAVWLIVTTTREVFASQDDLIWPEKMACCHEATQALL